MRSLRPVPVNTLRWQQQQAHRFVAMAAAASPSVSFVRCSVLPSYILSPVCVLLLLWTSHEHTSTANISIAMAALFSLTLGHAVGSLHVASDPLLAVPLHGPSAVIVHANGHVIENGVVDENGFVAIPLQQPRRRRPVIAARDDDNNDAEESDGAVGKAAADTGIRRHRVRPTDTLQGIALLYNVKTEDIRRANSLWASDSIHLRDVLIIPLDVDSPMDSGPPPSYAEATNNMRRSKSVPDTALRPRPPRDVMDYKNFLSKFDQHLETVKIDLAHSALATPQPPSSDLSEPPTPDSTTSVPTEKKRRPKQRPAQQPVESPVQLAPESSLETFFAW